MIGITHYAGALTLFADELVYIQTTSLSEDYAFAPLTELSSSFPLLSNFPDDSLIILGTINPHAAIKALLEYTT